MRNQPPGDLRSLPYPAHRPTLTVEEAAQFLRISRASAYQAAHRGEIPTLRVGRRFLVPTARLRTLLGLDPEADADLVSVTP